MVKGTCTKCDEMLEKRDVPAHLQKCILGEKNGTKHHTFILKIADRDMRRYWMFLKMYGTATLEDLDAFLREEWLECCDHMSEFMINNGSYGRIDNNSWEYECQDNRIEIDKVLSKGLVFSHTYDFGDATTLGITVIDEYFEDEQPKNKIEILIKNNKIDHRCKLCRKSADVLCTECYHIGMIYLCHDCEDKHGGHATCAVANSPRIGTCCYS